jgi:hypothetical protein
MKKSRKAKDDQKTTRSLEKDMGHSPFQP